MRRCFRSLVFSRSLRLHVQSERGRGGREEAKVGRREGGKEGRREEERERGRETSCCQMPFGPRSFLLCHGSQADLAVPARQRDAERHRATQRDTARQRERDRERERHSETQPDRQRETARERDGE